MLQHGRFCQSWTAVFTFEEEQSAALRAKLSGKRVFACQHSLALARVLWSAREPHHRADKHIQCVKCHQDAEAMWLYGWKKCLICFNCHSWTSYASTFLMFTVSSLRWMGRLSPEDCFLWHQLLRLWPKWIFVLKATYKMFHLKLCYVAYVKPQCFPDLISQAQSSRASIMYRDRIATALLLNVARVLAPQTNAVKLWGELCRTPRCDNLHSKTGRRGALSVRIAWTVWVVCISRCRFINSFFFLFFLLQWYAFFFPHR